MTIPGEQTDLAYLAGIFDGEGYISPRRATQRGVVRMTYYLGIANTSTDLMEWLGRIGGNVYSCRLRTERQVYEWRICRQIDVLMFLRAIQPYLRIKRDKANRTIAHLEARIASRSECPELELLVARRD